MTFMYPLLNEPIRFSENRIQILVVENTTQLRRLIRMLQEQIEGGTGEIIFAENAEIKELSKGVELILDPFSLEFDGKRLLTKLSQEACGIGAEYAEQFQQLMMRLHELASEITLRFDHEVTYSLPDSWDDFIKMMNFRVDVDSVSFPEQILEYMRLLRKFFAKRLFIFYNLKAALTSDELAALYRMIRYDKLNVLLIEDLPRKRLEQYERMTIVDEDLCIF